MSRRSSTASSAPPPPRVLHLDAFSGIAGNMMLGALLDAGLPRRALEEDLAGLGVAFGLRERRVRRGALAARYVHVDVQSEGPGRHWSQIRRLLSRARLPGTVRERALAIFESLARAEARVHGVPVDRVHFHEVGAVDAIVDVVGAVAGLERLGVQRVTSTPLALGHGRVETAHGTLPLPAPATLELLRGLPVVPAHVDWETVTPTGAAIARHVVDAFTELPALTVEAIGHGAGDDRPGPLPNVLRAVLGRTAAIGCDRVVWLETHLDDLVPEHVDHLMDRLFEAGALDVAVVPLQMKKNRPGFGLRVLCRPSERWPVARALFAESTALGVRVLECERLVLEREVVRVDTPIGRVRVKRVHDPEGHVSVSAEYDDCKRLARRTGRPLREVVQIVEEAARAAEAGARRPAARRRPR